MKPIKLIQAIKKKLTEHPPGCCSCGGTPTAPKPPVPEKKKS